MYSRLRPPNPHICKDCHGMGFYYIATPGRNEPLEAVLRKCDKQHVESIMVNSGTAVELYTEPPWKVAA